MSRIRLATVVAVAGAALAASTLNARTAATVRFEYMRLAPGIPESGMRAGYQACVAKPDEWSCRAIASPVNQFDDALRRGIATLGSEGWELVSIIDETANLSWPKGPTYVFKRPLAD